MHTTATDGRADAWTMARAARDTGLEYIAITDHSKALAMANGLDETRALEHARQIRALNGRDDLGGLRVLAGIECDILPDGRLDLAADCLAELDIVIASVHSALDQDEAQMTDRLLRAIECPWVDVIAHPTGAGVLRREPSRAKMDRVFDAAMAHGVALEINSQPDRLDLDDVLARRARDRGVRLIIDTDAHSPAALGNLRWGVTVARRAWLEPAGRAQHATVRRLPGFAAPQPPLTRCTMARQIVLNEVPDERPVAEVIAEIRRSISRPRRRPSTATSIARSTC